jgi:hypothetical protein
MRVQERVSRKRRLAAPKLTHYEDLGVVAQCEALYYDADESQAPSGRKSGVEPPHSKTPAARRAATGP